VSIVYQISVELLRFGHVTATATHAAESVVYASEGFRGALVPQVPHIRIVAVAGALLVIDAGLIVGGLKKFYGKAVS
jgi:hypothetical protein